jgi:hypothetical protein
MSWIEIVGVVEDVRDEGLEREGCPRVDGPLAQRILDRMAMMLRAVADPSPLPAPLTSLRAEP